MNLSQLKAPDWRWQLAKAYILSLLAKCMLPTPTDPIVAFTVRIIRAYKSPASRLFLQLKYPVLMSVYSLGSLDTANPMRCQLLAAILSSDTVAEILDKVLWVDLLQLRFYKDVFFDIDLWKHIPLWVLRYLIMPVQNRKHTKLFRTRVLAMLLGYDAAKLTYIWGKGSRKLGSYMQLLYNNLRLKNIFNYFITLHNIDLQTLATLVASLLTKRDDRLFQKLIRALASSLDATIVLMARDLHKAIRTYTVSLQLGLNLAALDDTNLIIQTIIVDSNKEQ